MIHKQRVRLVIFAMAVLLLCLLCGCASNGEILSETNGDTLLCVEVSGYTGSFERTITIKNAQSGTFSVALLPSAGNIAVSITDGNGDTLLSMNEQATLADGPAVTEVASGNGSYKLDVQLKQYSGSFDISWAVVG